MISLVCTFASTDLLCVIIGKHYISICYRPNNPIYAHHIMQLIFKSVKQRRRNMQVYCLFKLHNYLYGALFLCVCVWVHMYYFLGSLVFSLMNSLEYFFKVSLLVINSLSFYLSRNVFLNLHLKKVLLDSWLKIFLVLCIYHLTVFWFPLFLMRSHQLILWGFTC